MKAYNLPGQVKLRNRSGSRSLSTQDSHGRIIMTGIGISLKEPYLNAGIVAGLDMKFWDTRVLIKDSEHLYYQYFDKGYLVYCGAFKDFVLSEKPTQIQLSV